MFSYTGFMLMNDLAVSIGVARDTVDVNSEHSASILIVGHEPAPRNRLRQSLDMQSNLKVCGEAATCEQAWPLARRLRPDLVLADASHITANGSRWIKELRRYSPGTKVLILSARSTASEANRMLRAGADGFITYADLAQLADAIRDVLAGFLYVSEDASSSHASRGRAEPVGKTSDVGGRRTDDGRRIRQNRTSGL
jgi:DNA-binding NarL/FixJ family response regulator